MTVTPHDARARQVGTAETALKGSVTVPEASRDSAADDELTVTATVDAGKHDSRDEAAVSAAARGPLREALKERLLRLDGARASTLHLVYATRCDQHARRPRLERSGDAGALGDAYRVSDQQQR